VGTEVSPLSDSEMESGGLYMRSVQTRFLRNSLVIDLDVGLLEVEICCCKLCHSSLCNS
jgi:hypothetical protein